MALSTKAQLGEARVAPNRRVFREEILTTATKLFADRGYRATNLGDVAKQLHVTRQALYYHFPSKADILFEIFSQFFDRLNAAIDEAVKGLDEPGQRYRAMLMAHVSVVAEQSMYSTVFVQEHRALPERFEMVIQERRRAYHRRFVRACDEAVKAGYLRSDIDPEIAVSLMFGAANWTYRWFRPGGRLSAGDVAQLADKLLFGGMLAK